MSFSYRNYKGVVAERLVIPFWIFYGKTKYHPKLTWLLFAWDLKKKNWRCFDLKNIL